MLDENHKIYGLSEDGAKKRVLRYGHNVLKKSKPISKIQILISQYNDVIIWILIAATFISFLMGEKADAITILIIVVMNGILGFIQEYKTEKSLEELKKLAAPTSKVIRNKEVKIIKSEDLVPDDVIVIETGDKIPADGVIFYEKTLKIDESILTGESLGVVKNIENSNKIYMGTTVISGKGMAIIKETGMRTEMGKIAKMLDEIKQEKSPLKEKLNYLGKILVIICLVICAVVTLLGILRGENKYEMFLLGVSLSVAAIPEGLPAIVTVSLAIGVSRMLKRNALVRKLPAVETLGCTSFICSDKTGTLTENNMKVIKLYTENKTYNINDENIVNKDLIKNIFFYCSDCSFNKNKNKIEDLVIGEPTEKALILAFINKASDIKNYKIKNIVYEIPFDSIRKMMSVVIKENNKYIIYSKGAPDKLIKKCKYYLNNGIPVLLTDEIRKKIIINIDDLSKDALRCIAAAYKEESTLIKNKVEENLIFVSIAGMIDPPRKEVKDAVIECKLAHITPVMITGDYINTAYAIGREIGICKNKDQCIEGEAIDKLNDKKLSEIVHKIKIYARVTPKHKLRIIEALKNENEIVAMTGDGVNDAPAIKESDIGISMGISGTDVTKEASSMILLDDNFATIISAVKEGRIIYDNIRKFIRYLLSCNLGEVLTMLLASLLYLKIPLLPIQILFVNLATDGLPALALGLDPGDNSIMSDKPRKKNANIFADGLAAKIVIRGCLIGICSILAFLTSMYYDYNIDACRTITLATLVLSQLFHVFECRSLKKSIFDINPFTNLYLLGAVAISVFMLISVIYIPFFEILFHTVYLDFSKWLIVMFFSGSIFLINSIYLKIRK